ncbi:MAG: hypothetical protein ACLTAS_12205 [Butyribacter sp.]
MQKSRSEVRMMDKAKNITELQKELDHRAAVEKLAEKMIIEGKFEEAKELLYTLDDDKVRNLMEECPDEEITETYFYQDELNREHSVDKLVTEYLIDEKFDEAISLLKSMEDEKVIKTKSLKNDSSSDKCYAEGHEEVKRVKQLGRMFVKKEPFEIMAAFASTLFRFFYLTMKLNKNFRMVLEYDAEATNVYVHFEKIMESFSRCNHPEY